MLAVVLAGCSKDNELDQRRAKRTLLRYVDRFYCEYEGGLANGCLKPTVSLTTSILVATPTQRQMSAHVYFEAMGGRHCGDDVTASFDWTTAGEWVMSSVSGNPKCEGIEGFFGWQTPSSLEWKVSD